MPAWHIITCEYPPQIGGVSDYTRLLSRELTRSGDEVHVWAPEWEYEPPTRVMDGITLHRALGAFGTADLQEAGKQMSAFPAPLTLLVQWVPHGYGQRSMNVGFCRWIARMARAGHRVYLMIHEPF